MGTSWSGNETSGYKMVWEWDQWAQAGLGMRPLDTSWPGNETTGHKLAKFHKFLEEQQQQLSPHLLLCRLVEEFEQALALLPLHLPLVHHVPHLHLHCVIGDWGRGRESGKDEREMEERWKSQERKEEI